jgi:hypothetical protein
MSYFFPVFEPLLLCVETKLSTFMACLTSTEKRGNKEKNNAPTNNSYYQVLQYTDRG